MSTRARSTGRPSLPALALLLLAGLATLATSPAHRSASIDYEEEVRLTAALPAALRYLTLDVVNRDTVYNMVVLASATTETVQDDMRVVADTPGVSLTLLAAAPGRSLSSHWGYSGTSLDVHEPCARRCALGIWVIARLDDPASLPAGAEVSTNLEVAFYASGEEGTDQLDMDLSLVKDAERSFETSPTVVTVATQGRIRVSDETPEMSRRFGIVFAAERLEGELGFPLVAEIIVEARDVAASGHPNAHSTHLRFDSPFLPDDAQQAVWGPYAYVGISGSGYEPPQRLDLLPLCQAGTRCEIDVTLESMYDEFLNLPDNLTDSEMDEYDPENPPPGFVELEWFLSVRLEAYDGRSLPDDVLLINRGGD